MEEANEVQEALSRSYGTPEIDEDDLEAGQEGGNGFFILLNIKIIILSYSDFLFPWSNALNVFKKALIAFFKH